MTTNIRDLKPSLRQYTMKSSRAVSHVNVEMVSAISETASVSVKVGMMCACSPHRPLIKRRHQYQANMAERESVLHWMWVNDLERIRKETVWRGGNLRIYSIVWRAEKGRSSNRMIRRRANNPSLQKLLGCEILRKVLDVICAPTMAGSSGPGNKYFGFYEKRDIFDKLSHYQ